MPKDNQALKPDTFISQLPTFIKEKQAKAKGVTEEEIQLATLSRTAGWSVLREYMLQLKDEMDKINEQAIASGADFSQIGENTVIITQTKQVLDKIINKVLDAREASEKK